MSQHTKHTQPINAQQVEPYLAIAPGEHWCVCCGESCGPDGHCERCGRDCPRCDGHHTVLASACLAQAPAGERSQ